MELRRERLPSYRFQPIVSSIGNVVERNKPFNGTAPLRSGGECVRANCVNNLSGHQRLSGLEENEALLLNFDLDDRRVLSFWLGIQLIFDGAADVVDLYIGLGSFRL